MPLIPMLLMLLPLGKLRHRLQSTLEEAGILRGPWALPGGRLNYPPGNSFAARPRAWRHEALPFSLEFGHWLWQAGAALGLLWMQGRSQGTEKHHRVKGVLGPDPQLQGTRLGLLHVDSPSAQLGWLLIQFLL